MEINSSEEKDRYYGGCNTVHNHAKRRPPPGVRDKSSAILPEILDAMSHQTDHHKPRRDGDRNRRDYDEYRCYAYFDADNDRSTVGHGETDIDGSDDRQ
jgi:hypothetical protein